MDIIKSVSESFSMQPKQWIISTQKYFDNTVKGTEWESGCCKEIKLERIEIGKKCGDPVEELYYVGYNFAGKKLFQFIANAVNIEFA